ncbi:MAG: hypothetical protein R3D25_14785 [Geminicoccaceae bacterium]
MRLDAEGVALGGRIEAIAGQLTGDDGAGGRVVGATELGVGCGDGRGIDGGLQAQLLGAPHADVDAESYDAKKGRHHRADRRHDDPTPILDKRRLTEPPDHSDEALSEPISSHHWSPLAVDRDDDCDATLEQMIALTGGDTSQNYIVTRDGDPVGELDMKDLVKALAPETGTTGTNTAASP